MKTLHFLAFGTAVGVFGAGVAFLPESAMAQRALGVDVSSYQEGITWSSVKSAGYVFAWAKATEGTSIIDGYFTQNEANGKAAGLYMGAYHFAYPDDSSPASQSSYFWSEAGGYILNDGKTLMPMLDMEEFSGVVGAASYTDWANDWCVDVVASASANGVSVKPCIYVSACNAGNFNSGISQWIPDIANYGAVNGGNSPQSGTPWSSCSGDDAWGSGVWSFWQYESVGTVSGISGNVDHDVFNGTAATLASTMVAGSANSAIYYWDPQGTGGANPYTGSMTGTWENSKWSSSSAGQATPTAWVEGKAACFGVHTGAGTPSYTVTMNANHVVAGFFDGPLVPNACNVTITGSGVIDLATGAQGFDALNASDGSLAYITINNVIAGDGQAVPEGTGQIYFNGANTYSGGTQLGYSGNTFTGIVNFNSGSSFGTGPISLTIYGTGSALVAEGTGAITIPNNVTLANTVTNNFVGTTGGVTYSGNWGMGANTLTFETGNTAGRIDNISGVLSGTAGFNVSDAGTLILSGADTYSGNTAILSPAVLTIGGAGQLGSGSYAGAIANAGTLNYSSTAAQTLSGIISGTGPLNQTAGTLVLSGASTYTGNTTLGGGVLQVGHAESAGTSGPMGKSTAAGSIILGGGTLQFSANNKFDYSSRFSTAAGQHYNIDVNGQPNVTFATALNSGSGVLNLSDSAGGGILKLSAVNTYTGATAIQSGTLALAAGGSINNTPTITLAAGATFDVSAFATYSLSVGTAFKATGASSPATIKGGTTVNLGSQPVTLAYDGSHPALTISSGILALNGNTITVNGSVLSVGSYILIHQASGNVSSAGSFTLAGTAIPASGVTAAISVSSGDVILTITDITATTLNPLSPSTYGQPVTFTANVQPVPTGGSVQFFDNNVALGAPVTVNTGTAAYTTNTLAIGNHPITAAYSGTAGYAASATVGASNQQVVLPPNSVPVTITSAVLLGGAFQMSFSGVPGYTYLIECATNLVPPVTWTTLNTNVADINGNFNFTDTNAPSCGYQFYRTATQ